MTPTEQRDALVAEMRVYGTGDPTLLLQVRAWADRLAALPMQAPESVKVGELIVTEHKGDLYYAWSRDGYERPQEPGTYDLIAVKQEPPR